ncbi:MAG: hypothetical protein PHE86_03730 [Candidatus Marinimicrobia bacterium]|nr:hypothetical protein [Candidatus Neomarinimicrobiota bacterium]MDD5582957.1 hypothetical protein [Candidatus Neomarinimicrobiota bacterium]
MISDEVLKAKIEALAESTGLWIEDIRIIGREGDTLQILCDKEGGIQFVDLQQFSKTIQKSKWFDEDYSEQYNLEVSSPGLDFPLTQPRHFKKNQGRQVKIRHTFQQLPSPFVGDIMEVTDTSVILRKPESAEEDCVEIPFDTMIEAKIKIKW